MKIKFFVRNFHGTNLNKSYYKTSKILARYILYKLKSIVYTVYKNSKNVNNFKHKLISGEDTNMRFSPSPVPGDSGFNQWRDAMKMVARLPGGIPPEFRRKVNFFIYFYIQTQ